MAYKMTAARKAALRKAQAASARKRRGKGKGKLAASNRRARRNRNIAMAAGGLAGAAALAGYGMGRFDQNLSSINRGKGPKLTRRKMVGAQMKKRKLKKSFKKASKKK
jgi:hypothetical protein